MIILGYTTDPLNSLLRVLRLKRFLTFSTLIWLIAASVLFILVCVRPLQDAWAYCFWDRVPCKVTYDNGHFRKFLFNFHDHSYNCGRLNFWFPATRSWVSARVTDTSDFNRICYVSPRNPEYAVLNLDAHKRFDLASNSLFLSAFVICVAVVLTLVARRRVRLNQ